MDALSDVLRAVRLSGAIFFDIRASQPWVAETPPGRDIVEAMFPGSGHLISYHVIVSGECWACMPGEQPLRVTGETDSCLYRSQWASLRKDLPRSCVVFSRATPDLTTLC